MHFLPFEIDSIKMNKTLQKENRTVVLCFPLWQWIMLQCNTKYMYKNEWKIVHDSSSPILNCDLWMVRPVSTKTLCTSNTGNSGVSSKISNRLLFLIISKLKSFLLQTAFTVQCQLSTYLLAISKSGKTKLFLPPVC